MRRFLLAAGAAVLWTGAAHAQQAGDAIRPLVVVAQPEAAAPQEYQAAELAVQAWKQLGLDIRVQPLTSQQYSQVVWYERQKWDATTWQMVGRPERSDPDELTYNLFFSGNAANGYDFVNYINPEYDRLAQAQRQELDLDKRRALIQEAQQLINRDQPYTFTVDPKNLTAFNANVWDEKSVVSQQGIGIRNFWTWISLTPKTARKDVILNSTAAPTNLNPFNIPGAQGSWATELVWDRLMRIGPDGLPKPWAASAVTRPTPTEVDVTLRDGMKWSDGSPVTVDDAVFSLQAPGFGDKSPMYRPFVLNIASVEATGPNTLKIMLKHPDAAFLTTTLSKLNLASKKEWQPIFDSLQGKPQTAESIAQETPVSSGPYRMVKAALNQEIILVPNPDHWAAPKAGRWIMRIQPDIQATLGALKSGEINFLADYTGDPQLLDDLAKSNPNIKEDKALDLGFRFIAYNERRPPFNDVNFRRALSAAIDRQTIADDAYGGEAEPANSWVSSALSFWADPKILDEVPGGRSGSVATAKKILQDAGYTIVNGKLHYPAGVKEATPPYQ